MEWMNESFLDNSLGELLLILLIVTSIFLLRRFLSNYIATLIFARIHRRWNTVDRSHFFSLILQPLGWFVSFSLSFIAIGYLQFPEAWNVHIRGVWMPVLVEKLVFLTLFFLFMRCMLGFIEFFAEVMEHRAGTGQLERSQQLIVFFKDFLKTLVFVAGFLGALKIAFDVNVGSLITGFSIVGAALALAAKESVENLIASFIIFFDKPFSPNDTVRVQQITGTVESIGLRSTRIRTADHTLVTVPNKQMVDSIVDNWNQRTARRSDIQLEFMPGNALDKITAFADRVNAWLGTHAAALTKHQVLLTNLSKNGILLSIEINTPPGTGELERHQQLRDSLIRYLHQTIQEMNLELSKTTNV